MGNRTVTAPPTNLADVFGEACPDCEHDEKLPERRGWLGKTKLARCPVPEYDYSGLSDLPCGCRNLFHTS